MLSIIRSLMGGLNVYVLLSFTPIITALIQQNRKDRSLNYEQDKKIFCVICGIALFLAIALRSKMVGSTDSLNYYNHWQRLSTMGFSGLLSELYTSTLEKGYIISVWILSRIFKSGQFAFVFSGVLFSLSVSKYIYKYSDEPVISFEAFICLGIYTFMVQGMRQAIAMSICLFAIKYAKEKRLIPFLLLVILAVLYHKTAVVFIIIYFLYGRKVSGWNIFLAGLISIVVALLSPRIISVANSYWDKDYTFIVTSGGYFALTSHILILLLGILLALTGKNTGEDNLFFYMSFIGTFTFLERYFGAHMVQRLSYFFLFGEIVIVSNCMKAMTPRSRRTLRVAIVVLCISLYLYRLPREGLTPYMFFWQE